MCRKALSLSLMMRVLTGSQEQSLRCEAMAKTILTVDDSASVRQMVKFTLSDAGYSVIEAVDGKDALAKLTLPVNMVITDLNMPNLDGIGLIRGVRANPAYKGIPIIMLTT